MEQLEILLFPRSIFFLARLLISGVQDGLLDLLVYRPSPSDEEIDRKNRSAVWPFVNDDPSLSHART